MDTPVPAPAAGAARSNRWVGALPVPLPRLGEERLARLAGEGDERAFSVLYERYHQMLYRYCRSLVRDETDAHDALQSTFAAALTALQRGQRDAPLRPWLFRIAHNESISLLRRRRPEDALSDAIESTAPSVEQSAEERARMASLVADLGDLPERQRGALLMRELSGLTHEQIAEALGISVGAAKQTVFEARRSLMELAEGRAMPCDEIQRVISDGDGRALRARRIRAHLHDCSRCAAFAAAIPAREADLRALAPVLPVAAATGILAHVTGAGAGHGTGTGGLAAGATGKATTAALSLKAVTAGVVVVVGAAAGTTGVLQAVPTSHPHTLASHAARAAGQVTSRTSGAAGTAPGLHSVGAGLLATYRSGATVTGGLAAWATGASNVPKASAPTASGISGSALGLSLPSGTAAGPGSSVHPGSAGHTGSAGHSGAAGHRGAAKHSTAASHPGAAKHSTAASHPGAAKHSTATSHPRATKRSTTSHAGTTKHSTATSHPGSTSHPTRTGSPQPSVPAAPTSTAPTTGPGSGHINSTEHPAPSVKTPASVSGAPASAGAATGNGTTVAAPRPVAPAKNKN